MEEKNKTCSKKLHEKIMAIIYCQDCKIYMCDKCKQLHSDLFDLHHIINLDKNINNTQNMEIPNVKQENWIEANRHLIDTACYDSDKFDSLLDEIEKYSESIKERQDLYEKIKYLWEDKNVYGATITDDGTIFTYIVERYDF